MCEINHKHSKKFVLEVWTSIDMTPEQFQKIITEAALNAEIKLNEDMRVRWHVHEVEPT